MTTRFWGVGKKKGATKAAQNNNTKEDFHMHAKTIVLAFMAFTATQSASAAVTHYSSDFENAIDAGNIIDSGGVLTQVFGDVSLGGFGSLSGTALIFNPTVDPYEQVSLLLGGGRSTYRIEFDLETQGVTGSGYAFTMLADTPEVQTLSFANCCDNRIDLWSGGPGPSITTTTIGALADNTPMHVAVDIDLDQGYWMASVSGVGSAIAPFYASDGDVFSLRFSLSPALGGIGLDPSVFVGMDNLTVTTVPIPPAIGLFGAGLVALLNVARKRAA